MSFHNNLVYSKLFYLNDKLKPHKNLFSECQAFRRVFHLNKALIFLKLKLQNKNIGMFF
jgi:hypothetical protein